MKIIRNFLNRFKMNICFAKDHIIRIESFRDKHNVIVNAKSERKITLVNDIIKILKCNNKNFILGIYNYHDIILAKVSMTDMSINVIDRLDLEIDETSLYEFHYYNDYFLRSPNEIIMRNKTFVIEPDSYLTDFYNGTFLYYKNDTFLIYHFGQGGPGLVKTIPINRQTKQMPKRKIIDGHLINPEPVPGPIAELIHQGIIYVDDGLIYICTDKIRTLASNKYPLLSIDRKYFIIGTRMYDLKCKNINFPILEELKDSFDKDCFVEEFTKNYAIVYSKKKYLFCDKFKILKKYSNKSRVYSDYKNIIVCISRNKDMRIDYINDFLTLNLSK